MWRRSIQLILLSMSVYNTAALATGSDKKVHVAVRAHAGLEHAMKKWGPTIDYLTQAVPGYRFIILPYTSLKQQLADARLNRFDFILTHPSAYVELEAVTGARALLTLINDRRGTAQSRFGSVIFTHIDDAGILRLQDLKGKDFLAVSRFGFGGWQVGLKVLMDNGIDPDTDFASLNFAGKQPAVVRAVLAKQAHAGMVRTDMLEWLSDKGEVNLRNVRILNQQHTEGFPFFHSTPLYPEWPFAVMPNTPPALAARVKQALLKIDRHHPAARAGHYMAWTEALDYQPVKQLLADIGVAPFAKRRADTVLNYLPLLVVGLLIAFFIIYRYSKK